ncbi:MAG: glutamate 5-kinase [Elusimicrobia bacterium]|nr:glutamate 5-kinase [Elusimicrobiota bacterium]
MRIVIKLGTRLLTREGMLDKKNIARIAGEIGELLDGGNEVIIVSSGAIGAGCGRLGCSPRGLGLREKQALASVGQTDLMNAYKEAFAAQKRPVGQILITAQDLADRKSYLNIRNTLFALLEMKVVPIINENDTVAVEEIKLGDNDYISAIITSKVDADMLIILTDVDGLLSRTGKLVKKVEKITREIERSAGGAVSGYGVGGMATKVEAARIVSKLCGVDTYLANGRKAGIIRKIAKGENPGTVFKGTKCGISHKKRWIAYGSKPAGSVGLDGGAVDAVRNRKSSLLAVGIRKISGTFREGDSISFVDEKGKEVGRGLVNYSSKDLKRIIGKKSTEIEKILGYKDFDEVINRDNMVLM